jgi:hypothetical protein
MERRSRACCVALEESPQDADPSYVGRADGGARSMTHAAFSEAGVDAPALNRPGTAFRCRGPPTYTLTLLEGRACQLPLEPEGSQEICSHAGDGLGMHRLLAMVMGAQTVRTPGEGVETRELSDTSGCNPRGILCDEGCAPLSGEADWDPPSRPEGRSGGGYGLPAMRRRCRSAARRGERAFRALDARLCVFGAAGAHRLAIDSRRGQVLHPLSD